MSILSSNVHRTALYVAGLLAGVLVMELTVRALADGAPAGLRNGEVSWSVKLELLSAALAAGERPATIALGNSTVRNAFSTASWRHLGLGSAWNLGAGGGTAATLPQRVNEVLRLHHPRRVIIGIDPRMLNGSSAYLNQTTIGILSSPEGRLARLRQAGVPWPLLRALKLPAYFPIVRSAMQVYLVNDAQTKDRETFRRLHSAEIQGWQRNTAVAEGLSASPAVLERLAGFEISDGARRGLLDAVRYLRAENVDVILAETPIHPDTAARWSAVEYAIFRASFMKTAKEAGVPVVMLDPSRPYSESLFCDIVHLNDRGAERWTSELAVALRQ